MNSDKGHSALHMYFGVAGALEKAIEWLAAILFFFILLVSLAQVFFRYVLNSPLVWSEEMARYLGIFMIMLATSNAIKRNAHIGIDVLSSRLPASVQKPLRIFCYLMSMFVMGFLAFYASRLMKRNFFTPTPAMRIPIGIPYFCMTFSCYVSALVALLMAVEEIFNLHKPEAAEKGEAQ
ncbi:MAG: TRAP transporter small permease [Treponema sp.]|jgi:TRAP-type C4-dicarboxylate transport system permease small subunit|nr:TRAP transporter small permease [Treponema sp.]